MIVFYLFVIVNTFFTTAAFPEIWKHALVMPLFKKKGNKKNVSSYMPVSLSHILSKIVEKMVSNKFSHFL